MYPSFILSDQSIVQECFSYLKQLARCQIKPKPLNIVKGEEMKDEKIEIDDDFSGSSNYTVIKELREIVERKEAEMCLLIKKIDEKV